MMVNKTKIKEIIQENHNFIISINKFLKRENIVLPKKSNKVIILYGIRRSGKTFTLFEQYKKFPEASLYIDFEDERLKDFSVEDFETLKDAFFELKPQNISQKSHFFLDEIQNIKNWEKFCRRVTERENISVSIAGSSSKIMPHSIHTSLRGREWTIEITPFSFREYLIAKNCPFDEFYLHSRKKVLIKKLFYEFLNFGGFPEVIEAETEFEKRKLLKEYLNAMFFKDLIEKFNMTNISLFELLTDKLFSSFSQKFSLNAFYNKYKEMYSFSKDLLYSYYKNFLSSNILFETKIFAESPYKRARNPSKIYLADVGLCKKILSKDYGRVLENIVFLHLRKFSQKIFYFSEEKECDFVANIENKFYPIQVCYELNEENREREIQGLILSCKWLDRKNGILLTYDQEEKIKIENINIHIIPVWKWIILNKSRLI